MSQLYLNLIWSFPYVENMQDIDGENMQGNTCFIFGRTGFANPLLISCVLALVWQHGKAIKSGMSIEENLELKPTMCPTCVVRVGIG